MNFKIEFESPSCLLSVLNLESSAKLVHEFRATEKQISALLKLSRNLPNSDQEISITPNHFLKDDLHFINTTMENLENNFLDKNSIGSLKKEGLTRLKQTFLMALKEFFEKNKTVYRVKDYEFHFTQNFEAEMLFSFTDQASNKSLKIIANTGTQIVALLKLGKIFAAVIQQNSSDKNQTIKIAEEEFLVSDFDYLKTIMNSVYEYARQIKPEDFGTIVSPNCVTSKSQAALLQKMLAGIKETIEKYQFEFMDYDLFVKVLKPSWFFKELADIRFHNMISPILEYCISDFPKKNLFRNKEGGLNSVIDSQTVQKSTLKLSGYWSTWKVRTEYNLGSSEVQNEKIISCLVCKNNETAEILQQAFDECYQPPDGSEHTLVRPIRDKFLFVSHIPYALLLKIKDQIKINLRKLCDQNKTDALINFSKLKI